jgi:hypothetical protein
MKPCPNDPTICKCAICKLYVDNPIYRELWDKGLPGTPAQPVQPPLPGLLRQGLNLITAVAQHVATGMQSSDSETYQKRMAICKACPKLRPDNRCSGCGCFMNVKASWDEQKCPDGKW